MGPKVPRRLSGDLRPLEEISGEREREEIRRYGQMSEGFCLEWESVNWNHRELRSR